MHSAPLEATAELKLSFDASFDERRVRVARKSSSKSTEPGSSHSRRRQCLAQARPLSTAERPLDDIQQSYLAIEKGLNILSVATAVCLQAPDVCDGDIITVRAAEAPRRRPGRSADRRAAENLE